MYDFLSLSLSDCGSVCRSIVVDGTYQRHEGVCFFQAFVLQYFYLASYLWTACFAFHLYQIIVKRCVMR